jgi:hypothetical protein
LQFLELDPNADQSPCTGVNAAAHVLQFNAFYSNLKFGGTGFLFLAAVQKKAIAGV